MITQRIAWVTTGLLWLGGVVSGLAWLAEYNNRPGLAAHAPAQWPAASHLLRDAGGPTLVMILHPRCDCSQASVAELAELLARAARRPRTYVVFIKPDGVSDTWETTSLWEAAARIPGVTTVRDDGDIEAGVFGAATSGQVLLYDAGGRLAYSGGITVARGHTGDNAGRAAVLARLGGATAPASTGPVFGCELSADHATRVNVIKEPTLDVSRPH